MGYSQPASENPQAKRLTVTADLEPLTSAASLSACVSEGRQVTFEPWQCSARVLGHHSAHWWRPFARLSRLFM